MGTKKIANKSFVNKLAFPNQRGCAYHHEQKCMRTFSRINEYWLHVEFIRSIFMAHARVSFPQHVSCTCHARDASMKLLPHQYVFLCPQRLCSQLISYEKHQNVDWAAPTSYDASSHGLWWL